MSIRLLHSAPYVQRYILEGNGQLTPPGHGDIMRGTLGSSLLHYPFALPGLVGNWHVLCYATLQGGSV